MVSHIEHAWIDLFTLNAERQVLTYVSSRGLELFRYSLDMTKSCQY